MELAAITTRYPTLCLEEFTAYRFYYDSMQHALIWHYVFKAFDDCGEDFWTSDVIETYNILFNRLAFCQILECFATSSTLLVASGSRVLWEYEHFYLHDTLALTFFVCHLNHTLLGIMSTFYLLTGWKSCGLRLTVH